MLAAATRRAPDIPNLAYRVLRFRREAFSAPVCDVLPERRRREVSCHHRRRSNRRVALPTGRRIIGLEFGQAIVHRNARRTTNTRSVTSCTVPTVNSLARLSTYKVRTFKSRHLLSFSPAHHLMAVHFPRLTACALVAPEWRIQQGIEEDPERCMRTRTSTWWKPGVLGK